MILIIYILCKLHIMQLLFLVFKYSQVKEAHIDQDRITCEPVKLGKKPCSDSVWSSWLNEPGSISGLGVSWLEQLTVTVVNWSLKQGVCLEIAYWEQSLVSNCGEELFGRVLVGPGEAVPVKVLMVQSALSQATLKALNLLICL